jgi:hypothetical protein
VDNPDAAAATANWRSLRRASPSADSSIATSPMSLHRTREPIGRSACLRINTSNGSPSSPRVDGKNSNAKGNAKPIASNFLARTNLVSES